MNHQPFEDWLLEDEPLDMQQQRELQMHLRGCTNCAAIADANLALHSRRMAAPAPGFSDRFRPRLAAWKQAQLRRQALGTIILVLAGLVALYVLAGPAMLDALRSPAAWLADVAVYVVALFTFMSVLGQVGGILVRNLPGVVPAGAWFGLFLLGCAAGLIWISTMRKLARAPQGA